MNYVAWVGFVSLVALGGLSPLSAQSPSIEVDPVECIPRRDRTEPGIEEQKVGNARIQATVRDAPGGGTVRTYFRWIDDDHQDLETGHHHDYYVEMVTQGEAAPAGGLRYWTMLPKAEDRNERVLYYAEVLDAAGRVVARHPAAEGETLDAPVDKDCVQPPLTEIEHGFRNALTIGEIDEHQEHDAVHGFLCEGIIRRRNSDGVLRADDKCNPCAVAWWIPLASIAPAFALEESDDNPVSPTRPAVSN